MTLKRGFYPFIMKLSWILPESGSYLEIGKRSLKRYAFQTQQKFRKGPPPLEIVSATQFVTSVVSTGHETQGRYLIRLHKLNISTRLRWVKWPIQRTVPRFL